MDRVRKISETYPIFKQVEKATGGQVKGEYFFVAVALALFFALFSKSTANPLTNMFAVLLIANSATSVIVSKATLEMSNVKHIISYLLTFSIFTTIDSLLPFINRRIPFYYHAKLVFFYYLSIRRTQLTEYLNTNLYSCAYDTLRRVSEVDVKEKIKTAQSEASKKVKDLSESLKDVHPTKEE